MKRDAIRIAMGIENRSQSFAIRKEIRSILTSLDIPLGITWAYQDPTKLAAAVNKLLEKHPDWNSGVCREAIIEVLGDIKRISISKQNNYTSKTKLDKPRKPARAKKYFFGEKSAEMAKQELSQAEPDNPTEPKTANTRRSASHNADEDQAPYERERTAPVNADVVLDATNADRSAPANRSRAETRSVPARDSRSVSVVVLQDSARAMGGKLVEDIAAQAAPLVANTMRDFRASTVSDAEPAVRAGMYPWILSISIY